MDPGSGVVPWEDSGVSFLNVFDEQGLEPKIMI